MKEKVKVKVKDRRDGRWAMESRTTIGAKITATALLVGLVLMGGLTRADEDAVPKSEASPAVREVTLGECIDFAIENSFDVKLAKLDLYIAETKLLYSEAVFDAFLYGNVSYIKDQRQQLSVFSPDNSQTNNYLGGIRKKLPTGTEIDVQLSDTRVWNNSAFISKNPSHDAELKFNMRQPVTRNSFGFADRANITLTKMAIENADLETQDRIEALVTSVETSYVELLFARKNLEIFEGMKQRAIDLYENDKKSFDIGLIERVDLYNSEANLATRDAEVVIARNSYLMAENDLKLKINMQDDIHIVPAEGLVPEYPEQDLPACLKTAFELRRDYKIHKRDVDIKGLALRVKGNMLWPEIDLVGTMMMNGLEKDFKKSMGKVTVVDNVYYYGGIEVDIPIENSLARSEYDKAGFEKEHAIVNLKKTERTIITQVADAYDAVEAYGGSIKFLGKAVMLQSAKLEEENKRYKYGRSSTKTIIDYQRDLLRAELENSTALMRQRKAKAYLDRIMNITLQKYEELL